MTSRAKLSDPIYELGAVVSGDSLERLKDIMVDPGANRTLGETARIGQALVDLGNSLLDTAKQGMDDRLMGMVGDNACASDAGVMFQWYPPTKQTRVDTRAVKALFPKDEYPNLYITSDVSAKMNVTYSDNR